MEEAIPGQESEPPLRVRDEEGALEHAFVERVEEAVAAEDRDRLTALVGDLHESDLGDVLEALAPDGRDALVRLLGTDFDWIALTEVDESVRTEILEAIPNEQIAEAVRTLDSDDAIAILEDLPDEDREEVLADLPFAERIALERSLDYPEESAGRRMTTNFIAVPPFWTVGQTIDFLREDERLPDQFTEIYVVDPRFQLLGTVSLDRLLRTKRPVKIGDIMGEVRHSVNVTDDQEDVARLFERYNLLSVGVVDDSGRIAGVITIDDIVDIIEEEADEDIRRLAGVGDEAISDTVASAVRSRIVWLMVSLGTAALASFVISLFDGTIEQMVALAILMPIVASMGGNAGTQTMTVAVRALATRDIDTVKPLRLITRETLVGFTNGVIFAVLIGALAAVWFDNAELGGVIAAAIVINMLSAGLFGILVPLTLDRLGIDPAIASAVFVIMVTDVVGFFAFLGLAAWWFGLG
ncbi:MAG TPA: magnesium transporter [Afifellaceae bacterium]|nr:magnesium transporter [Afifellaceae bacterium]